MTPPVGPVWQQAAAERNWLVWREVPGKTKPIKRPQKLVEVGDKVRLVTCGPEEAAQLTFDDAQELAEATGLKVGYLPRSGSAMVIIDLDKVLTPEPEGFDWVDEEYPIESYCEVSASGLGLHILVPRGGWPELQFDGRGDLGLIASGKRFCALTFDSLDAVTDVRPAPKLREMMQPLIEEVTQEHADEAAEGSGDARSWFDALDEGEQVECMRAVLGALPRARWLDARNDGWLLVTFALRPYPHLHEVWDEWSREGRGYNAEGNMKTMGERDRPQGRVTIGSLIHHAQEAGLDTSRWSGRSNTRRAQRAAQQAGERMRRVRPDMAEQADQRHAEREAAREPTWAEAEEAGELVLQWHNDPAQAILDARRIEQLLGDRRQVFSVGGQPSYIRRASISIRNPDTEEMEAGLAHVFQPVTDWATMCHGHVRYVAAAGARGRRPDRVIPQVVQKELEARAGALLPPLASIVQHPCLLPDGRLLTAQGAYYDEASHLWLDIAPVRGSALKFDTPEQAVAWIENEWLRDFAFDDRADCARAVTLAGSLLTAQTMLGEDAGPPCYAFTAPQASTGKTVLARTMCSAVTGVTTPTTTLPIEREEMRKVLFAMALQQSIAAIFDNVPRGRVINDPEACQFATDPIYTGRVLGATKMMQVSARMALVFTGNAVNPGGDMIPRSLTVRLRWGGEGSPSLRRFEREIISWTMDNRATVLEALRVILTAPLRPGWQTSVGRFPTWSRVVLQPIAQAFGLSAERLVQEWIEATAEDELADGFAILANAMTEVGMRLAERLVPKNLALPQVAIFTVGELRDLCTEAVARLDGCTPAEAGRMPAIKVSSIVGAFVDLSRGGLVLRRRSLNLGERTDHKSRVCFLLVPEGDGQHEKRNAG